MVNLLQPSILSRILHGQSPANSLLDYAERVAGEIIEVPVTVGGTGAQVVNMFEITGTVKIYTQWAELTRVGTLLNLTGMYADVYDGINTILLTDDTPGAVLSGAPVGSFFTKDKISSQPTFLNNSKEWSNYLYEVSLYDYR